MPSQILKQSLMPWAPGLRDVTVSSPADPGRWAARMLNVLPHGAGYSAARPGFQPTRIASAIDPAALRVAGVFGGKFTGRTGDEFVVISLDCNDSGDRYQRHVIYSQFGTYDVKSDGDFGATAGTIPDYLMIGSTLLIANPNRPVISYTRAVGARVEWRIPYGSFLSYHNSRLFVGRMTDNPGVLEYSKAGEWRSFLRPETNVRPEDAGKFSLADKTDDEITGLSEAFYGDIYAFTHRSINRIRINGDGMPERDVVSKSVGCDGNQTIRSVGNDLFWCSSKGVHSLATTNKYGDVESSFLSAPIQRLWNRIPPEDIAQAWATYWPRYELYCIAINLGQAGAQWDNPSPNDSGAGLLVYHVPSGRWAVWSLPATACCLSDFEAIGTANLYLGLNYRGTLQTGVAGVGDHFDVFDSIPAGQAIYTPAPYAMDLLTEWLDQGDPGVRKNYRGVTIYFRSGAQVQAMLRYQIEDRSLDSSTRLMPHKVFHLNPQSKDPYISVAGFAMDGTKYLTDTNSDYKQTTIPLSGSGSRIQLGIFHEYGHRLEIMGLDLHYIVESAYNIGYQETGDETVETLASAGAKGGVSGIAAGDGPAIPPPGIAE